MPKVPPQKTTVYSYITYKSIMRDGVSILQVPCASWNDERIKNEIYDRLKNFDPIEGISYCAFLNMAAQNQESSYLVSISNRELHHSLITNQPSKGMLFNRYSLQYLMTVFSTLSFTSTEQITGNPSDKTASPKKFYEALLLANDLYSSESKKRDIFSTTFLREWPYYYNPNLILELARCRIIRYKYIFLKLSLTIPTKIPALTQGINDFPSVHGITLENFFQEITSLMEWFLSMPLLNATNPRTPLSMYGFKPDNINSFYIQKAMFAKSPLFIQCLKSLARTGWPQTTKRITDIAFYDGIKPIFDNPIFQRSESEYCIADLGFLLENIGTGLIWRLLPKSNPTRDKAVQQRGYLLEEYFIFLLNQIFPTPQSANNTPNSPDAIIETNEYVLIFEFTTEKPNLQALFSADKILLAHQFETRLFRTKDNKPGKLVKLNDYIKQHDGKDKKIIPILITECKFGDIDLIDSIDQVITNGLKKYNLTHLHAIKPTIMDLDDLENFWHVSDKTKSIDDFAKCLNDWNALSNKGPYHYSLANYFLQYFKSGPSNPEWDKFFRS